MRFELKQLLDVFSPRRREGLESAEKEKTLDAYILALQKSAWRSSGIEDKLRNSSFPLSGHFDPPPEIEEMIALSLVLAGDVVGRPIVCKELLTTEYQEKLTPPFIYANWFRLQAMAEFPNSLRLGDNTFFATAPTGKIYPVTDLVSDRYVMIFDANLLLFYRIFLASISRICFAPEADQKPQDAGWIKWGGNFTFDRSLEEIFRLENETTNIASLLLNVAVQGLPYSESFALLKTDGKKELLISTFISDLYLYLLAHEIGHIHCRHFDNKAVRRAATITGENVSKEETEADLYAFALVANAVGQETGNFRLYIHTSLIFHTMSFLYRALHYLHFGRDYGHLPPQVQRAIWFPPSNYYPHPQARLFSLRREIRDKASVVPAGLDQWDREIDAFFENLWKPICLKLTGADHPVGDMWRGELALHGLAYTSNGFKPS